MFASLLASFLSPKTMLYIAIAAMAAFVGYECYSFGTNYVAMTKQVVLLQQNVDTATKALSDEQAAATTQHNVDQTTIDSVRQSYADQAAQLSIAQGNAAALTALGTPTNVPTTSTCPPSPYLDTIFTRLRQQRAANKAPAGDPAGHANAAH